MPPITHGACGRHWTGEGRSHCAGCHETFSSTTAFDRHQTSEGCHEPGSRGLVAKSQPWGTLWVLPGRRPMPERPPGPVPEEQLMLWEDDGGALDARQRGW